MGARLDVLEIGEIGSVVDGRHDIILTRAVEPEISKMILAVGNWQLARVGINTAFNMLDPRVVGYLIEFAGLRIRNINGTTRRRIVLQLAEGIAGGEGTAQLGRRIRSVFQEASTARALAIAKTEVTSATSFSRNQSFIQAGDGVVVAKRWLATRDTRTRDRHTRLNRQERPLNRPFEIDGRRARYPGDFASVADNVNCRCTIIPIPPRIDDARTDQGFAPQSQQIKEFDTMRDAFDLRIERAFRRAFRMQEREILRQFELLANDD